MTDLYNVYQDCNFEDPMKNIRTSYNKEDAIFLISNFLKNNIDRNFLLICIGTDRYIGDSLGPIIGTMLEKMDLKCPIFGTLEDPIHAVNLKKQLTYIEYTYPKHQIIAVDACLGAEESIGCIQMKNGCLYPGKGVGKKLPAVGDLSIVGIVDACDHEEFFFLHNIRLNLIMKMAEIMAKGIAEGLRDAVGSIPYK
ncbi:MAG: yyaC [Clostridiales bacterium]|nr:yyaC [Clostridiales bacterium]